MIETIAKDIFDIKAQCDVGAVFLLFSFSSSEEEKLINPSMDLICLLKHRNFVFKLFNYNNK